MTPRRSVQADRWPDSIRAESKTRRFDGTASGVRRVADSTRPSADVSRDGESRLVSPLRTQHRRVALELREDRRGADASGTARLAGDFVRRKRLELRKWLHRELLNPQAYRQSSQFRDESRRSTPTTAGCRECRCTVWKPKPSATACLAVSSQLDKTEFGSPDEVTVRNDGLITSKRTDAGWRRTVYVRQRRKEIPTILETFDLPQMIPNCVQRPNSTVASQALHLLNNGMVREIADDYAAAITAEIPHDRYRQIERVYQTALSRKPTPEETQLALETLVKLTTQWETQLASAAAADSKKTETDERSAEARALANFCHIILNSAEFLFVD